MTRTALIAGQGALPALLVSELRAADRDFLLAEMDGFPASVPGADPVRFRLERLVPFLDHLILANVTHVCFAGAVRRPKIEPELFDARTATLVPRILAALQAGDDGALRAVIAIFEDWGLTVVGADTLAPALLPPAGCASLKVPDASHARDAELGEAAVARMGQADSGQACVIAGGRVVATEGPEGTDAMMRALPDMEGPGGILFKAPKPGQDRRVDLPVIGPETVVRAAGAGLAGIVIEAGGVMVLDQARVREALDERGLFLWVRPHGSVR